MLLPIVEEAVRKLDGPIVADLLTDSARVDLAHDLRMRLESAFGPTIAVIDRARTLENTAPSRPISAAELAQRFPAFQETLSLVTSDWLAAKRIFLRRLRRDFERLPLGLTSAKAGRVSELRANLSDPHDRGQTVTCVGFEDGRRVIYKPRSCHGETLWFQLLRRLTSSGVHFRQPAFLPRAQYHWMEFIAAAPASRLAAVRQFYLRWGIQTALARMMQLADLHHKNWIAAGEQPVLLDAEFFGPSAWVVRKKKERRAIKLDPLEASGLLPIPSQTSIAGARGVAPFDSPKSFENPPDAWPRFNGRACPPCDFAEEIIAGFDHAIRASASLERTIARAVRQKQSRIVVRSTREYFRQLAQSLHPAEMLSATSRYARLFETCARDAPSKAIARAEASALLGCSIPRFYERDLRSMSARFEMPSPAAWRRSRELLRARLAASRTDHQTG